MEYLRIATEYYKMVNKPINDNSKSRELVRWKKSEIITDKGKDFLQKIKKYDGFTNVPSHTNFQQTIGNFYNRYSKLNHVFIPGEFPITTMFLKHIFGYQYDVGLDYLSILWHYPKQILPILCLVSEERNTGKSTFLEFLRLIFKDNLTINTNDDFRGRFNTDWAYKVLICIDEVLLQKREDSERLKHLSTAKSYKAEAKGVDKVEVPFYAKTVLCTNNEDSFVYIDENEIRYWVVKVNQFNKEIPDLLDALENELPHFMFYLNKRKIKSKKKTRMWFTSEEIYTDALENLRKGNENVVIRELKQLLLEELDKYEVKELQYTTSDLVDKLKDFNLRVTSSRIIYFLNHYFKLSYTNSSYKKYFLAIDPITKNQIVNFEYKKGRYYTFTKEILE
ncbi:primase-helicase family protein [Winogradskyella poriferorum]|uniref:primase-helicase family protein n=1 Tax=Winogradskyella poriferorum TaxID=307627 RepID=UPI003D64FF0F